MATQTQAPAVEGGVVAYLQVDGAIKAAEFYKRAFGAELAASHPPDDKGRTMHVHLYINGSSVMLCDPYPEHGHPLEKPQGFNLMLPVNDIDAAWQRATEAGAEAVMPPMEMFWGDRYGPVARPVRRSLGDEPAQGLRGSRRIKPGFSQMQKIKPFLWFDGKAEEAAHFYTALFKGSKITGTMRYGDVGPGPKGSVMSVTFELNGQQFIALNGGPQFTFSPAISFFVTCETQDEVDELWDKLLEGGQPQQCGWLTDKYGLSWQIVPSVLGEMLQDKDAAKSTRVMQAMLGMIKLDIATLKEAHERP